MPTMHGPLEWQPPQLGSVHFSPLLVSSVSASHRTESLRYQCAGIVAVFANDENPMTTWNPPPKQTCAAIDRTWAT